MHKFWLILFVLLFIVGPAFAAPVTFEWDAVVEDGIIPGVGYELCSWQGVPNDGKACETDNGIKVDVGHVTMATIPLAGKMCTSVRAYAPGLLPSYWSEACCDDFPLSSPVMRCGAMSIK